VNPALATASGGLPAAVMIGKVKEAEVDEMWSFVHRPVIGKRGTQQLERKHLTLRTRIKCLVRRTIYFSRSLQLHEIVIGLFLNRFEFGLHV
jgi:insertion element IS1 protein InsB